MTPKQLKELQAQWAKRLKDSGFEDIERSDGTLRTFHSKKFSMFLPEELEERQRYFSLAIELGNGYKDEWGNFIDVFEGHERDRRIWMLYAIGFSEPDIATKQHISIRTVSRIINKYNKFIVRR